MKNGLDTAKNEPQVVAKTIARIFKNSKKAAFCLCQFSQIKKIIIYPQLRRPRTFSPWSIFSRPSWSCWRRSGPRRCANVLSNSCNSAILQFCNFAILNQSRKGSFSPVSTPNFASKYSLESSWRELQDAHAFAPLRSQYFRKCSSNFFKILHSLGVNNLSTKKSRVVYSASFRSWRDPSLRAFRIPNFFHFRDK